MKANLSFLFQFEFTRLALLVLFWLGTFGVMPVAFVLFPGESFLVFGFLLIIHILAIQSFRPTFLRAKFTPTLLVLADTFFAFYLAKYYALEITLILLMFLALVLIETLATGWVQGLLPVILGVISLWFYSSRAEQTASILSPTLPISGYQLGAFILLVGYVVSLVALSVLKSTLSEAEKTSLELTSALVQGELAKEGLVKTNRQMSMMLRVAQGLTSSLESDELLKNFELALHEILDFDNFSVLVFDAKEKCLKALIARKKVFHLAEAPKYPLDFGVAGHVFSHGKSKLIKNTEEEPSFVHQGKNASTIGSMLSVPLYYREEPIGVLTVDAVKKDMFEEEHLKLVEGLAPLLAIAVNNAMQFATMKVASTRDTLTHLYNYSAFTQRFNEVLETCYHLNKPVTLLMIDIDDFKQVNDTYGHLTGNLVLANLGEIMSKFFRRSDVIARYGGEEFAAVLPRTPIDVGLMLGENLREEISVFPFRTVTGKVMKIMVSVGVASSEDDGINYDIRQSKRADGTSYLANVEEVAQKIIRNADEALYRSKVRGKNRVTASSSSKYPHKDFTEHLMVPTPSDIPAIEKKKISLNR